MDNELKPGILNRYHPGIIFLFRPVYKSFGGRYNPLVAENASGVASYIFHMVFLSAIGGGISGYIQRGDTEEIKRAAVTSLLFPAFSLLLSLGKYYRLRQEKEGYRKSLPSNTPSETIDLLVEEEFARRKVEYAKTPKIYL